MSRPNPDPRWQAFWSLYEAASDFYREVMNGSEGLLEVAGHFHDDVERALAAYLGTEPTGDPPGQEPDVLAVRMDHYETAEQLRRQAQEVEEGRGRHLDPGDRAGVVVLELRWLDAGNRLVVGALLRKGARWHDLQGDALLPGKGPTRGEAVAQLAKPSVSATPQRGDHIIDTLDGDRVYVVTTPDWSTLTWAVPQKDVDLSGLLFEIPGLQCGETKQGPHGPYRVWRYSPEGA